jgi:hypothetical protein
MADGSFSLRLSSKGGWEPPKFAVKFWSFIIHAEAFFVKKSIFCLVLSLTLMSLSLGCGLFSPQSSKATIEISYPTSGNVGSSTGCSIAVNLDGVNTVTVGYGSVYTFPLANSGTHTVNLNPEGNACNSSPCTISGSSSTGNYADTFQANSGDLYVVLVTMNSPCNSLSVSGP